ncbi:Hypothetical predicted protein [Paramuricea clavata]|uniref:Uncharacterized protein n=1 Tax=Paramuricea clavata TaxID=317549 RepID=A0A7D9IWG1_PARCT|nr:Hypothetical predicted protein [Paramuricea clavata]
MDEIDEELFEVDNSCGQNDLETSSTLLENVNAACPVQLMLLVVMWSMRYLNLTQPLEFLPNMKSLIFCSKLKLENLGASTVSARTLPPSPVIQPQQQTFQPISRPNIIPRPSAILKSPDHHFFGTNSQPCSSIPSI